MFGWHRKLEANAVVFFILSFVAVTVALPIQEVPSPAAVRAHIADALRAQLRDARNRNAAHALHDHDLGRAVIPVNLGHEQQVRAGEIAPQQACVRGFAREVEFVFEVFRELRPPR